MPRPGSAPDLQGPKASRRRLDLETRTSPDARLAAAAATAAQTAATAWRPARAVSSPAPAADELFYPNKADRPWRYIVLHHSASASGNYDEIDREHRKILGYEGCGYHFVIGNGNGSGDGQIEVAQRWNNQKQGVHCRNARSHDIDEYGIGICLVGDLDQQPPTPARSPRPRPSSPT